MNEAANVSAEEESYVSAMPSAWEEIANRTPCAMEEPLFNLIRKLVYEFFFVEEYDGSGHWDADRPVCESAFVKRALELLRERGLLPHGRYRKTTWNELKKGDRVAVPRSSLVETEFGMRMTGYFQWLDGDWIVVDPEKRLLRHAGNFSPGERFLPGDGSGYMHTICRHEGEEIYRRVGLDKTNG